MATDPCTATCSQLVPGDGPLWLPISAAARDSILMRGGNEEQMDYSLSPLTLTLLEGASYWLTEYRIQKMRNSGDAVLGSEDPLGIKQDG